MASAVYPGTFDPVTNGHLDLVQRASRLFDPLIVAVARNAAKAPFFSFDERIYMMREAVKGMEQVRVVGFGGLLVEVAGEYSVDAVVRGLRAVSDFEYEMQMALMNRRLDPQFETVFLTPSGRYTYLNASLVREIASMGGDVSGLVPDVVKKALDAKFGLP